MYPWFTWNIDFVYPSLAVFFIVLLGLTRNFFVITKKNILIASCFLPLIIWTNIDVNLAGFLGQFIRWIIITSLICVPLSLKNDIIYFITKWFGIIMIISIFGYVLFLIGIGMPHQEIQYVDGRYHFENYYLFLKSEQPRFFGPFMEPGHMTMGLAPILFLNKYYLKNKYVLFLFIAQILSFSLAGYITLMIGFLLQMIIDYNWKNTIVSTMVIIVLSLGLITFINTVYLNNVFEERIIERLQWSDGKLSGDNRSSDYLDKEYEQVVNSSDIWTGRTFNVELSEKGVSGYKLFIVEYGVIGVLCVIVAYFSTLFIHKTNNIRKRLLLLLILVLLLLQNAYPLWWCMIISLICGMCFLMRESKNP